MKEYTIDKDTKTAQESAPEKVTIDTNCLIDYLDPKHPYKKAVIRRLLDLHEAGVIQIYVSTRLYADVPKDPLSSELLSVVERLQISTAGAPFRLDESQLDSGDYLVDNSTILLEQMLKEITAPDIDLLNTRNERIRRDIDHLVAHANSGNKCFITSDKEHILSHKQELEWLGIRVISPEKYLLRFINAT